MGVRDDAIAKKKCITHRFRVSFPEVFEPKAFGEQEARYSIVMLFPDDTSFAVPAVPKGPDGKPRTRSMERAVENAKKEKWGNDPKKWPKNLRDPFRDGAERSELQGYADTIFVTANSKNPPGLVDQKNRIITEKDAAKFYPGCWARAEVIANAYDQKGNKGVKFTLMNIQKLEDDEPFTGRKDASAVFDAVDSDDEDDDQEEGEEGEDSGDDDGFGF